RLGAGRDQTVALAVVAERTLVGVAAHVGAGNDAEWTGGDAVGAAVADVRLDVDVLELVVNDRAGRARLLARGGHAVLADVATDQPTRGIGRAGGVSDRRMRLLRSLTLPARQQR